MPYFTNEDYAAVVYMYGFCNGDSRVVKREYHTRFPTRRVLGHSVFTEVKEFVVFSVAKKR